jgi:hypothetical protein
MAGSLSMNGLKQFEIKGHKVVFGRDLSILSRAISAITALSVVVFLNYVSMSGQVIVFILRR